MVRPKAPKTFTQTEVANRVGCSRSTVQRAVERNELEVGPGGRFIEAAIAKWRELVDQRTKDAATHSDLERRLLAAETGEREAKQKLRELELQRESGKYVELELVQEDAADARERVIAVLRSIPQRVAMAVDAALSAPADRRAAVIEQIVMEEVERAIAELAEAKFGDDNKPESDS